LPECEQLLADGLIEPTNSNWACPAFYVNKRSEQVRGKKRLVIDYKTLNHFLLDDKFPLPRTQILFSHLGRAKYFSKFDQQSGFWQLGVHPIDTRRRFAFLQDSTSGRSYPLDDCTITISESNDQNIRASPAQCFGLHDVLLFSETLGEHRILLQEFIKSRSTE